MSINYKKPLKLLMDKDIEKSELKTLSGVSTNVIAKLGKNGHVSMETLEKSVRFELQYSRHRRNDRRHRKQGINNLGKKQTTTI